MDINSKFQITKFKQIPIIKRSNSKHAKIKHVLVIEYWNLFVICILKFGILSI